MKPARLWLPRPSGSGSEETVVHIHGFTLASHLAEEYGHRSPAIRIGGTEQGAAAVPVGNVRQQ